MPTVKSWACCVLFLFATGVNSLRAVERSSTDRYADDRYANQRDRYADDVGAAAVDYQAEIESTSGEVAAAKDPAPAAAPAQWQEAPQQEPTEESTAMQASAPRVLFHHMPVRWQRAPASRGDRAVVQASAVMVEGESSSNGSAPQPLGKPKNARPLASPRDSRTSSGSRAGSSPTTLLGSVAVVLGLFVLVVWFTRRGLPKQPPQLPREALEVLGRQRLFGKQELQLVRLGKKLVLLNITPGSTEPLAEVTDAEEVDRLTGLCYQQHPHSNTRGFQRHGTAARQTRFVDVRRPFELNHNPVIRS
jgi:flagellar biogenesis protein FliO